MDDKKHAELCERLDRIADALEKLCRVMVVAANSLRSIDNDGLTAWVSEG